MSKVESARTPRVLRRPESGRVIAGVCAGLAAYFGKPVALVRVLMSVAGLAAGLGIVLYLFWWATIPTGDPFQAAAEARPAALSRLAPRLNWSTALSGFPRRDIIVGLVLLCLAAFGVAVRSGWQWQHSWIPPAALTVGGLALAWSQVDAAGRVLDDDVTPAGSSRAATVGRVGGGLVLLLIGVLMLLGQEAPGWALIQSAAAALAVLLGVGLVLTPWWLRLVRALGDERAARVRAAERADIAAHLHDSVLQTLALIRANAADADTVARISRAQERELREWLYADRAVPGTSVASELRALVAQVEDGKLGKTGTAAAAIDVVVVGDCEPDASTDALLQATREALVNAVAHGQPPVSVYLEVGSDSVSVFVRDRGEGFELTAVEPDRLGVRESTIGRMQRRGGTAEIVSRPSWGTEVRLMAPRVAASP